MKDQHKKEIRDLLRERKNIVTAIAACERLEVWFPANTERSRSTAAANSGYQVEMNRKSRAKN